MRLHARLCCPNKHQNSCTSTTNTPKSCSSSPKQWALINVKLVLIQFSIRPMVYHHDMTKTREHKYPPKGLDVAIQV